MNKVFSTKLEPDEEMEEFNTTHKKKFYKKPLDMEEETEIVETIEKDFIKFPSSTSLNLEGYLEKKQKARDDLLYNERFDKKI